MASKTLILFISFLLITTFIDAQPNFVRVWAGGCPVNYKKINGICVDSFTYKYVKAEGITSTQQTMLLKTFVKAMNDSITNGFPSFVSFHFFGFNSSLQDEINMVDTTMKGAFKLVNDGSATPVPTVTYSSSNGLIFNNSTNQCGWYLDLGYTIYQKAISEFDCSYGFGRTTNNNPSPNRIDFGIRGPAAGGYYVDFYSAASRSDAVAYVGIGDGSEYVVNSSTTDGRYRVIASRSANNILKMYKNGLQFGSTQTSTATEVFSSNQTNTGANLFLGCLNQLNTLNQNSAFPNSFSPNGFSYVFVRKKATTDAEAVIIDRQINILLTGWGINQIQ